MGRCGTQLLNHVFVIQTILGMVISVKDLQIVLEIEFMIEIIKFVFALMDSIGMVTLVLLKLLAVVDKLGMILHSNAIVQLLSIGMEVTVFTVLTVKFGILIQKHVSVKQVLNGTINFVRLFRIVKEELFGIKILGLVNVQLQQFGVEHIVWLTLAQVDKFGIM